MTAAKGLRHPRCWRLGVPHGCGGRPGAGAFVRGGGGRVSLLLLYPGDLCSHRRTRVTGRTRLRAGRPRSSALRQPRGSRSSSSVGGSPGRTRGRRSPRRRGLHSLPQSLVLSTAHSASFLNNRSINTYFSINVRHFSF